MPYFICETHKLACVSLFGLRGHWNNKHQGEPMPDKEKVQVDEIPEGFTTSQFKKPEPGAAPRGEFEEVKELPHEPVELFRTLLKVNGVPQQEALAITQQFRLAPFIWNNAGAITKLLRASRIKGLSNDWLENFLNQYTFAVELPADARAAGFVGRPGATFGGFGGGFGGGGMGGGGFPFMGSGDPVERMIAYNMWEKQQEKLEREREKVSERGNVGPGPDPETAARMANIEAGLTELLAKKEEDKLEKRFNKLEDALAVALKGGGEPRQDTFLTKYLEERDKRTDSVITQQGEVIKDMGARLERAVSQIGEARSTALADAEASRKRVIEEMKGVGWTSRTKSPEEQQFEFAQGLIPVVDRRFNKFQDSLDRLLTGGGPAAPGGGGSGARNPVTGEEAARLAEAMTIQEKLRGRLGG